AVRGARAGVSSAPGPPGGAFLPGVPPRRAHSLGTMVGMIAGLVISLLAGMLAPYVFHVEGVAWTWNVAVGAIATFVVGMVVSVLVPAGKPEGAPAAS